MKNKVITELKILAHIEKAIPDYKYDPEDFEVCEFKDPNENFIGSWNEEKLGPRPTIAQLRNLKKVDENRMKEKQQNKSKPIRFKVDALEARLQAIEKKLNLVKE